MFINRRRDRIKTLYWDSDGLAIWYKRLESGTFENLQSDGESQAVVIDTTQFAMLLGGAPWQSVKRRKRFRKTA